MPTVLVTTPTGHIGSRVVEQLLRTDADVRVFARDPARLSSDVRARVEAYAGSIDDGDALARAMDGADAAFLLSPPHYTADDWAAHHRRVGEAAVRAATRSGVARVVFLSSQGAHRDDLGPIAYLGAIERALRDALPNVAALRPAYFFENTLAALPTIAESGVIYGNFDPDFAFPQVASRDIGDVAARWLLDATWTGHHIAGVHGPRDLSMAELAALAGQALDRPVRYVQIPAEALAEPFAAAGMTPDVVRTYVTMFARLAETRFERPEARTAPTTTPTEFSDWARAVLPPAIAGVVEPAAS